MIPWPKTVRRSAPQAPAEASPVQEEPMHVRRAGAPQNTSVHHDIWEQPWPLVGREPILDLRPGRAPPPPAGRPHPRSRRCGQDKACRGVPQPGGAGRAHDVLGGRHRRGGSGTPGRHRTHLPPGHRPVGSGQGFRRRRRHPRPVRAGPDRSPDRRSPSSRRHLRDAGTAVDGRCSRLRARCSRTRMAAAGQPATCAA